MSLYIWNKLNTLNKTFYNNEKLHEMFYYFPTHCNLILIQTIWCTAVNANTDKQFQICSWRISIHDFIL